VGNKSKPDPAIYLHAAEKLGSSPQECIVIEDAPNGIQSAKSAGMKCIGIATTFTKDKLVEADLIANGFEDIKIQEILNLL
jgi:beta-phosphoglucomutase-like phosphatase (HAD superfamily)